MRRPGAGVPQERGSVGEVRALPQQQSLRALDTMTGYGVIPAGWYRDSEDGRLHRYWDGNTWRPVPVDNPERVGLARVDGSEQPPVTMYWEPPGPVVSPDSTDDRGDPWPG